ncbi:PP2C family protein-serine/threonine phosphatase [Streptomyces natalensis]|uniref:PPM-type phosphatase domain-containing protein n=1 Tax=Streptomyces natalensis ATCC 27448 TaxID=1240678 RepID=A0A0D7CKI7_9ACTN|nr:PP2C family protein-serine/threonine phosphatase [Streptomyces natalensis]KIZ15962.1 hypothetical protein SNA_22180 [Streptomyces natalensis ATCC 27448]
MARAGHPAPARGRADGQVEFLDLPDGLPLGRGGAPFEKGEATLDDGDLLVLYTDGSPTGQGQGPETNPASLRRALSGAGLDDICDTIMGHLPPARRQDDVALLVARVRGLEPDRHVTWDLADDPAVVSEARALAIGKLKEWDLEELEFTTELLVSELATNAIRYGSPPNQLRLIRDRNLICEVSDSSSISPTSAVPWTPTKEDAASTWSPTRPTLGHPLPRPQ